LGLLFILGSLIVFYKFLTKDITNSEFNYFVMGLGGLFVVRKIFSYFKSSDYYSQNQSQPQQYNNYQYQQYSNLSYSPTQPEQEFVVEPNQQVQPEQTISPKSSY
jgi:hypothetical protein